MRLFPDQPPPGPFRSDFWRSPIRGPWLASVLSAALLPLTAVTALTGFASHVSYESELGRNETFARDPFTRLLDDTLNWPAADWLYAANQGLHVVCGLLLLPILLAKLWTVIPKLFEWPPVRSAAHALERAGLALLVGGSLFVLATGIVNLQYWYPWDFAFVPAHYYGAIVFLAGLAVHVAGKLAVVRRTLREEGVTAPLREPVPANGTISRRGALAVVGGGSLLLALQGIGQAVGGPLRSLAPLAPRGSGSARANDFQVNKTARRARVTPEMVGPAYRLKLNGRELSRADLLALPQTSATLPIACVEGWTATRRWTGVRLRDLARLAGVEEPRELFVESLQPSGGFRQVTLNRAQSRDDRSLLALRVEGEDLSLDHGFPARLIVPGAPGVHNTKWVASIEVRA
ncbi:MAG TPA: molybdopterin-dependent oxidoreductase [Solirubrobacteraceae bacterium]|jgi:DMSO/TMAO reductase YedYZ molybdopterin-dependent catalytic subunit|nr:molybdopterin-dependent oxidoreductase [Solirubrobacteraceae bacterium]